MDSKAGDAQMRPARIGLVIPSLEQGGAERVASVLANEWARSGNEVHVITFTGRAAFFELDSSINVFDARRRGSSGALRLTELPSLFISIRRYALANRLEAALSFMDKYNVFTIACLAFTGVRVTVSDRSSPLKRRPPWLSLLKRLSYSRAAGIIAQTDAAAEMLRRQTGASRIVVIPNPIVLKPIVADVERKKVILNVGRLVAEKGQEHLIRAFARSRSPLWTLVILGEGPMRARLEALIQELGVGDRVKLPGASTDVEDWYQRSSIFVLSSVLEGFPNVLVEAMAQALPCISFDCVAGPRDILDDGSIGLLVPLKDEAGLTDALERLMQSESLRLGLGRLAREKAEMFSHQVISERYLAACL